MLCSDLLWSSDAGTAEHLSGRTQWMLKSFLRSAPDLSSFEALCHGHFVTAVAMLGQMS